MRQNAKIELDLFTCRRGRLNRFSKHFNDTESLVKFLVSITPKIGQKSFKVLTFEIHGLTHKELSNLEAKFRAVYFNNLSELHKSYDAPYYSMRLVFYYSRYLFR